MLEKSGYDRRGELAQALVYARELRQLHRLERQAREELGKTRSSLKDSHQKVADLTALLQRHLERKRELDQAYSELVDGVRRCLIGEEPALVPPATPRPSRVSCLSPREVDVLQMVAEGHSNKEIATRFGISEHTIKNHLTTTMKKLGARDRAHAVTQALRQGGLFLG